MTIRKAESVLVVLSGGQDSTTCLLWAAANYGEVHAVTMDYGQKHRAEIEASKKVAEIVGVASHRVLSMPGLLRGRSPLIDPTAELETYTTHDEMAAVIGNRVEKTFVPLRNLLFLVVATNYALSLDCFNVVTGVCQMDNANYPDCTEPFINFTQHAIQEALGQHRADYYLSGQPHVNIITPLMFLSKAETVHMASMYNGWEEALAASHTCYAGEVPPCGKCHACLLRAEGFKQAGIADPLVDKWKRLRAELKRNGFGDLKLGELGTLEDSWQRLPSDDTEGGL